MYRNGCWVDSVCKRSYSLGMTRGHSADDGSGLDEAYFVVAGGAELSVTVEGLRAVLVRRGWEHRGTYAVGEGCTHPHEVWRLGGRHLYAYLPTGEVGEERRGMLATWCRDVAVASRAHGEHVLAADIFAEAQRASSEGKGK